MNEFMFHVPNIFSQKKSIFINNLQINLVISLLLKLEYWITLILKIHPLFQHTRFMFVIEIICSTCVHDTTHYHFVKVFAKFHSICYFKLLHKKVKSSTNSREKIYFYK